jgi:CHASE2 domain-containing sensor protein
VVSGTVYVTVRGKRRQLTAVEEEIPVRAEIDTRRGRLRLAAGGGKDKPDMVGEFRGGVFLFNQLGKTDTTTVLRLSQPLGRCTAASKGRTSRTAAIRERQLWGDATGRFQIKGRYSAATVRGTVWLVRDACDRKRKHVTVTRVTSGTVEVADRIKGKTVLVGAGRSYTARGR